MPIPQPSPLPPCPPPPRRYEDTREDRVATMSSNRAIHDLKKRTEAARLYRLDNKRVRRDKPEVEVCSRTGGGGEGGPLG